MSGNADQIRGHLEPLVLATLEAGPAHGYAIIEALRERSGGLFDLPEGTVYPALHRLEHRGAVISRRTTVDGRARRVYRLSAKGRRALDQSRTDWATFARAVTHLLGVPA
jgi:DNA-binding PadR family transcriptional regulator